MAEHSMADKVLDEVEMQMQGLEEGVPEQFGPEAGAKKLTDEQELRAWNAVGLDEKTQMPLTIEQVELEYFQKALNKEIPIEHVPSLVSRKMYPLRYEMIDRAGATDTEKVKYAEKMREKASKQMQPNEMLKLPQDPATDGWQESGTLSPVPEEGAPVVPGPNY